MILALLKLLHMYTFLAKERLAQTLIENTCLGFGHF